MHESTPISVMAALMPDLRFVPLQEFVPVFQTMIVPQLMLVHPSNPARTAADVIAQMRQADGDYSAASSGFGSLQHLALELFLRAANVKANHIPYRGGGPATTDLIGGQIKLYFGNVNSAITYVRGGQLRALAHTSAQPRIVALPDLPALSETLPGFSSAEWNGFFFRTGTAPEIVQRLSALCNEIVVDPAVAEQLRSVDLTAGPNTPAQFSAFFRGESEKWQKFIAETGIRME
jgi:tripartite-type tricarboxylate transporter receptor subunit TctC